MRTTLALLAIVLLLPAASAVYVEMPLRLVADAPQADVGDEVAVTIEPSNESAGRDLAGRTLRGVFTYDSGEDGAPVEGDVGDVTLDDAARGSFRWTVPAEADGKNVFLTLRDGDATVGSVHVAVGDAPPIMMATGGGQGGLVVDESHAEGGGEPARNEAPGFAVLAALGAALLVAVARRRA